MFTELSRIDGGSKSNSKDQIPDPVPKKKPIQYQHPESQCQSNQQVRIQNPYKIPIPTKKDLKFVPIDGQENVG